MSLTLLDRILPGRFDDFDFAPDDHHFDRWGLDDEISLGRLGLVATLPHGGRIPFNTIFGATVDYEPGWDRRGAPVMDPWAFMYHWTASKPSWARPSPALKIVRDGRPDVSGPLSQLHVSWRGRTTVIASGRANHAGLGDPAVLEALRVGRDVAKLPKVKKSTVGSGGRLIGVEVEHPGDATPYPAAVLAELARIDFNLRRFYGWQAVPYRSIDHARWAPDRKIDCVSHRSEIAALRYLIAA